MAPVQQFVSDALRQQQGGGHREEDIIRNDESQGQAKVNKVVVGTSSDGNCEGGKAAAASNEYWHQQQPCQLPRDRRDLIELFMDLEGETV